jgi:ribosome-binding factor A
MAKPRRMHRVAEKIRELLAKEILAAADDRFRMVSITSVMVTSDLREAKIYWVVTDPDSRKAEVEAAFHSARGHFRSALAKKLEARYTPSLKFFYDDTLDTSEEVERLIADMNSRNYD